MPTDCELDAAAAALRRGGLIIFPTETVYGVGADARNPGAVRRIFEVKARPATQALSVHVGRDADPEEWALEVPPVARELIEAFWPGPLTLVLVSRPDVPEVVRGGGPTVGLRMPDHPVAWELFARFGGGVAGTSANVHAGPSPVTAVEARAALGKEVDAVVDGGPARLGRDSTVLDCSGREPVLLREGALPVEEIEAVIGAPVVRPGPRD